MTEFTHILDVPYRVFWFINDDGELRFIAQEPYANYWAYIFNEYGERIDLNQAGTRSSKFMQFDFMFT